MSSITTQHMEQYTYIYESTSYWNKQEKRAENFKNSIGRIDTKTGETFYKQEYINKLKREGKQTDDMQIWVDGRRKLIKQDSVSPEVIELAKEILDTIKDYGTAYFIYAISEKIGLLSILKEVFPRYWKKLFALACYLLASNKAIMYCNDWIENNDCLEVDNMTSQRISELLTAFGHKERCDFYSRWCLRIRENEYVALDITSVSSYSKNIDFMEWGYNRDGEGLPQVNICMLFGEKSMLPIYQTLYSGSIGDVCTLESTLAEFSALTESKEIMLVMDKGFFSVKNVSMMLGQKGSTNYKFIIPVSFTSNFAKRLVMQERGGIDSIENIIFTSGSPIRGVHRILDWGTTNVEIHTHIFFNPEKALKDRNELYAHVARLKARALNDPSNKNLQKEYKQYLAINNQQDANGSQNTNKSAAVTVDIRNEVIEKKLETAGWFILISNQIDDAQSAYNIYRAKDAVEKSFFQYKNNLGINRFHVHTDERALNKTFVAFIALILSSHIHNTMREQELDKSMSFDKLLNVLSKLKSAYIKGIPVLRPLTSEQKLIFKSFDISFPTS